MGTRISELPSTDTAASAQAVVLQNNTTKRVTLGTMATRNDNYLNPTINSKVPFSSVNLNNYSSNNQSVSSGKVTNVLYNIGIPAKCISVVVVTVSFPENSAGDRVIRLVNTSNSNTLQSIRVKASHDGATKVQLVHIVKSGSLHTYQVAVYQNSSKTLKCDTEAQVFTVGYDNV